MPINLNFNAEDWERVEDAWARWWAGSLSRPLVMMESPHWGSRVKYLSHQFLLEDPIDHVLDTHQARLESKSYYGDAFPKWWPNFGPGIAAGFLGSIVHCTPDEGTVWFEPAYDLAIQDLELCYDPDNVWWRRIQDLTQAAVERWGDQVAVAHTDLGGNLDILASFRGTERLLYELYDAPEEVERLVNQITILWLCYYTELEAIIQRAGRGTTPWAAIRSDKRCYMLQSDFCYMISPKMFERFVLPDIVACCNAFDHGFYHLDGKGQIPHLDRFLEVDTLWGIQWIPGDGAPPPSEWLPLLKRIRDGGKLCQVYVSPQGALDIVQALGGQGFAFYINEDVTAAQATDLFAALTK